MTNLLDIRKDYLQAINMTDEDGVINEQWLQLLEKSELSMKEKAQSIAKLVWMFDHNIEAIKAEKERLAKLEKSNKANKERIKEWLSYNLQQAGIEKLDTELYKISFRKSESVEVKEWTLLPDEYQKVTITANKVEIKKALKSWIKIKWCSIIENNNIQIK